MPLPELIEICPLQKVRPARVVVPGSKSITNRALILAALSRGELLLRNALWSEDTQVMLESLQRLGIKAEISLDPNEISNRTIQIKGTAGDFRPGGTLEQPLELFVGNAGTAARFLAALVCLGKGVYRLSGVPRMHERPQAGLFSALRELGYRVLSSNDKLPVLIDASGPRPGRCRVSVTESSQFASALLLSASTGGWQVDVRGENSEELPYVEMTKKLIAAFPVRGGSFEIEPDASSGSYFVAANHLLSGIEAGKDQAQPAVEVQSWPQSGWQIDAAFPSYLPLPQQISRERDLGDSIMTAITIAPFAKHPVQFTELARLRVQECERVTALRTELTKCGAKVFEQGETLTVFPSTLHGAEIETYQDHRMAMCIAILGLKVPGIKIKNPACVKKTFPDFFQKLAALPPAGLGATLRDAVTQRELTGSSLMAD